MNRGLPPELLFKEDFKESELLNLYFTTNFNQYSCLSELDQSSNKNKLSFCHQNTTGMIAYAKKVLRESCLQPPLRIKQAQFVIAEYINISLSGTCFSITMFALASEPAQIHLLVRFKAEPRSKRKNMAWVRPFIWSLLPIIHS